jgi:hypothetical protein
MVGLAFATIAGFIGTGGAALQLLAQVVALNGAFALLAETERAFAAASAAAVVSTGKTIAVGHAERTFTGIANVADATVTTNPAAAVIAADLSLAVGNTSALAKLCARFSIGAFSAGGAAAVIPADLAKAVGLTDHVVGEGIVQPRCISRSSYVFVSATASSKKE